MRGTGGVKGYGGIGVAGDAGGCRGARGLWGLRALGATISANHGAQRDGEQRGDRAGGCEHKEGSWGSAAPPPPPRRAFSYTRQYNADITFDNVYITTYFRQIDARRKKQVGLRGSSPPPTPPIPPPPIPKGPF